MRLTADVVASLATPHHGVLTRAQLRTAGADDAWITRRVDSGAWQRLHRGVFATFSGPVPWVTRASGALAYAGDGAALSHDSAARLLGFTTRYPRVIDVTVPESRRVTAAEGLVIHRRSTMPSVGGAPLHTLGPDTVLDLVSGARSVDDAVGWLCAAARADVSPRAVARAAARRGPFTGRALLLELVAEVSAGIESPLSSGGTTATSSSGTAYRAPRCSTARSSGAWGSAPTASTRVSACASSSMAGSAIPAGARTPTPGATTSSCWVAET